MGKLEIIIASTRPNRVGLPVGQWIAAEASTHVGFAEVEVVDLAQWDLPFMNEPQHPRLGQYVHEHTRAWSAKIAEADAFVFVMPEYNFGYSAPLKNAIDYLHSEWAYKPVGFVSYGGVSAGTRAVQMIKQVVTTLRMVPVFDAVSIPFVQQFMTEEGAIAPNDVMLAAAKEMLDELNVMSEGLRPIRDARALA